MDGSKDLGSGSPVLLPELRVETMQAEYEGAEGKGRRVRLEVGCAEARSISMNPSAGEPVQTGQRPKQLRESPRDTATLPLLSCSITLLPQEPQLTISKTNLNFLLFLFYKC